MKNNIDYKLDYDLCPICKKEKMIIKICENNSISSNGICCKRCFKEINDKLKIIKKI